MISFLKWYLTTYKKLVGVFKKNFSGVVSDLTLLAYGDPGLKMPNEGDPFYDYQDNTSTTNCYISTIHDFNDNQPPDYPRVDDWNRLLYNLDWFGSCRVVVCTGVQ